MKLVIIESPFRGGSSQERKRNLIYLDRCIRDSIMHGESPYASHKMLPGALDEDKSDERLMGIETGYAWWNVAELIAFYTDYGFSPGMNRALDRCLYSNGYEFRKIGSNKDIVG